MARPAHAGLALAALAAALWMALHHPLSPIVATAGVLLACAVFWWRPLGWLTALPALLPVASLAPWSGWIVVDEFDLLVLAVIAAGHARALREPPSARPWPRTVLVAAALLALSTAIGLVRGWLDAPPSAAGWFESYPDPLNAWRVGKSAVFALALMPLLKRAIEDSAAATYDRLARGMLIGLALVAFAALRERVAYPGWLDFTRPYRTVAWFWEMHVGGAAIDAYLALATPFAAWAVWRAHTPWRWVAAALLALVVGYAALTTFSRGVYLAVGVPLVGLALWLSGRRFNFDVRRWGLRVAAVAAVAAMLGLALAWVEDEWGLHGVALALALQLIAWILWSKTRRARRWRRSAGVALAGALLVEIVVVLGSGSFMVARIAHSEDDFGSRLDHWASGLALVERPTDALLGIGLGRLPARYAAAGPNPFSGAVTWLPGPPSAVLLTGPHASERLGGLYRLTQRVAREQRAVYALTVRAQATQPVELGLAVCEMHLLYPYGCRSRKLALQPQATPQTWRVVLPGYPMPADSVWAPRSAVLVLSVLTPDASVRIEQVGLQGAGGRPLVVNGDFAEGLAHWYPSALHYFVPWHIDNLLLEVLIERGLLGVIALGLLMVVALGLPSMPRAQPYAPFLAASLAGVVLVGLVSSVMDVPRVALMCLVVASFGCMARCGIGEAQTTSPTAPS